LQGKFPQKLAYKVRCVESRTWGDCDYLHCGSRCNGHASITVSVGSGTGAILEFRILATAIAMDDGTK